VRGKAWSGTGPITDVRISLTGEGDWYPATVDPPKGPYHWQEWTFQWNAEEAGKRRRGEQAENPPWNRLGYGNNAIEVVYVDIR